MRFALIAEIPITPMRIIRYAVTVRNSTKSRKANARSYVNSVTHWNTLPTNIRDAVTAMFRDIPRKTIPNARSAVKSTENRIKTVPTSRHHLPIQAKIIFHATFARVITQLTAVPFPAKYAEESIKPMLVP